MDPKLTSRLVFVTVTIICVTNYNWALTIDNQLVSARSDCFERIALGAMLPFEKTFRMEDTNSLKMCQEFCLKENEKCQTIAFGIHVRGNGTCQLSSSKIDGTKTRPPGTIFDPDFDLYAKKEDCFNLPDMDNTIPTPGLGGLGDYPGSARPGSSRPPPLPFGPTDSMPPTTSSGSPFSTTLDGPGVTATIDDRYSPRPPDRYPTPESQYPTTDYGRYPSPGYSVVEEGNTQPFDTTYPTKDTPTTYGDRTPMSYDQNQNNYNGNRDQDRIYFQDGFPLYKFPMLYEQNYPRPNDPAGYPRVYAPNAPTLDDRYRPTYPASPDYGNRNTTPRPVYGLGYGNGYSYGTPVKYGSTRPTSTTSYDMRPNTRPDYGSRPTTSYDSNQRPSAAGYGGVPEYSQDPSRPSSRPTYASDGGRPNYSTDSRPTYDSGVGYNTRPMGEYSPRPDPPYPPGQRPTSTDSGYGSSQTAGSRPSSPGSTYPGTQRPTSSGSTRPSSSIDSSSGYGGSSDPTSSGAGNGSSRPGYGTSTTQEGKPGCGSGSNCGGSYGTSNRYPDELHSACFRRVLAGKRVAPHWVRRTLACERVEDCMQECGHEKRFTCEGFNYRLDPSGHGQGDCELIEVPLSEMDVYSSSHNRDSNLLRHPDYDYYERDRNAPSSCRQACTDCGAGSGGGGGGRPPPYGTTGYYRPSSRPDPYPPTGDYGPGTALDTYRPRPPPSYDSRPPPPSDYHYHSYNIDRHDVIRPGDSYRPGSGYYDRPTGYGSRDPPPRDYYRPPYRPGSDYSPYRSDRYPSPDYSDRDRGCNKQPCRFVPYLVGTEKSWGSYGGSYGGGSYNKHSVDYWGLRNDNRRHDSGDFNYLDLGGRRKPSYPSDNFVWNYPGSRYGSSDRYGGGGGGGRGGDYGRPNYGSQWTRRPNDDECSVKSSEGFRLHKGAVRHAYVAPTITECERLCYSEDKFTCQTYSYRYSNAERDNCLLCDRPYNNLDYYTDLEPDRDYDVYSMSDDQSVCKRPPESTAIANRRNNNQCFFRAIDATRFFKSIVRDSLTVRSIGECELECIKSTKFTCRAFAFRYGQRTPGGVIDNCQLSDWPCRDMDKDRHLIHDPLFDVFERASYGHGCELQPIVDDKHKKLCYLGYGSPAKLLSTAIKKVISVPTELECKNECIRYRENTPFKCYSFSFGSHASTFNCEMSDLDQSELKLNIHYAPTKDRDYWLFAWNPFDWTCRDKVTTIGGTRVNNDRRMDIFREPGDVTWRHFTVSGKQCRLGSECDKNIVTGFYSCEIEGGEVGSWDYCCKADHPCGYSQGFEYPWCFVGDERDQWRKCSDRYFPVNDTHPHPGITYTHISDSTKPEQYQQRPPRPGGLQSLNDFTAARLWPVTYLYSEGPPNSTELSNFVDCIKETC